MKGSTRLLLILACPAVSAGAQEIPAAASARPEVRTSATATRSVRPDLATITLDLFRVGRSSAEGGQRVAAASDSLRRAFEALGIPRDSVVSSNRWGWWGSRIDVVVDPPSRRDTTYRVHDVMEVRLHDLPKLGRIIDAALAHGVMQISNIHFSATNTEPQQLDALREATQRAKARAEAMASANGGTLGRALALSTEGNSFSVTDAADFAPAMRTSMAIQSAPATIVVEPMITVSVTVYGRWELLGSR